MNYVWFADVHVRVRRYVHVRVTVVLCFDVFVHECMQGYVCVWVHTNNYYVLVHICTCVQINNNY